MRTTRASLGLLCLLALAACGPAGPSPFAELRQPVTAWCTAQVVGVGAVDTETDYLPHVIACENGSADYEALKAQAVAARSVLYNKMESAGQIQDGQSDQVYTCARQPGPEHVAAVADTSGEVLWYLDVVVFAFYVSGAIPSTADCVPAAGDEDPHGTEHYVTYNWGLSGAAVEQSSLGWVDPGNHRNRGCQSQNGAHCLAEAGWLHHDILAFYYGMDAEPVQAEGACVTPSACSPEVAGAEALVDDGDSCFVRASCDSWHEEALGHGGHLFWTYAWDGAPDCTARWRLTFAEAGDYRLEAWVEEFGNRSLGVPYLVRHAGQEAALVLSQAQSGWLQLGTFAFAAGADQWVELSDATGEPYAERRQILVDALRITRAEPPADGGPDEEPDGGADGAEESQDAAVEDEPPAEEPDGDADDAEEAGEDGAADGGAEEAADQADPRPPDEGFWGGCASPGPGSAAWPALCLLGLVGLRAARRRGRD
ncbi:MAG TPA: SpoIID/LytB domain-containing protein [Myxococcota bacterium]|nr:SpoIID/LytB domain-containing protein [Myxococcota bacterium]HRY94973.1 SpoIID/LytB domain-containing protein [Myxococcota bacterium]HSA20964.1 SpoIID/LytB domain-containing protein [Myxococcota bacterium]